MKRALVATILGVVASVATVASSYGQGQVVFNTYVGTAYQPITYTAPLPAGATQGQLAGTDIKAMLYYGLGSGLSFGALSPLPASITVVGMNGPNPGAPGYVTGGNVVIPGYGSGPVTFAVVAFNGADWQSTIDTPSPTSVATLPANVTTWTEASIASGLSPADTFKVNLPAITVSLVVPEPSMLALAGLGAAGLVFFRRWK